jgi:hypothetical protein
MSEEKCSVFLAVSLHSLMTWSLPLKMSDICLKSVYLSDKIEATDNAAAMSMPETDEIFAVLSPYKSALAPKSGAKPTHGFRASGIPEQPAESGLEALPGGCARKVAIADSRARRVKHYPHSADQLPRASSCEITAYAAFSFSALIRFISSE